MIELVVLVLVFFVSVCAVASLRVRELVGAVFLLSAYSFFLTLLWSMMAAPDVAFTEAMAGAGAATIFFLITLVSTDHYAAEQTVGRQHIVGLGLVLLLGALFIWGSADLPAFADASSTPNSYLSPRYIQTSMEDTRTPNIVTAILADYRAFDTLIETTVIFTAGIACMFILRR